MSIIAEIEEKIKYQEGIPNQLERIDHIILNNAHLLTPAEIENLKNEKYKLQSKLIEQNFSLEEKNKSFLYTTKDIENAPDLSWLIDNVIPKTSIGVLIGASGSGKSSVVLKYCSDILGQFENAHIVYIDGDMSQNKLKDVGVGKLMSQFGNRFIYAGKKTANFTNSAQKLLKDTAIEQKKYSERIYLVIGDSLSLITPKKRGFIDTEFLYKHEQVLREQGGTILHIHHTNKAGVFADSQHIENYADYTYLLERNNSNSCILLHPQKMSRFDIQGKAFLTKDRKIIKEVDYESANISLRESQFIYCIRDVLEDGEMNQGEILKHLEKMRFFTEFKVGQKKAITWLKKWGDLGKWKYEKRPEVKNALVFWIEEEVQNCQTCQTEESDSHEI